MPEYLLTIDGTGYRVNWDKPNPPSDGDMRAVAHSIRTGTTLADAYKSIGHSMSSQFIAGSAQELGLPSAQVGGRTILPGASAGPGFERLTPSEAMAQAHPQQPQSFQNNLTDMLAGQADTGQALDTTPGFLPQMAAYLKNLASPNLLLDSFNPLSLAHRLNPIEPIMGPLEYGYRTGDFAGTLGQMTGAALPYAIGGAAHTAGVLSDPVNPLQVKWVGFGNAGEAGAEAGPRSPVEPPGSSGRGSGATWTDTFGRRHRGEPPQQEQPVQQPQEQPQGSVRGGLAAGSRPIVSSEPLSPGDVVTTKTGQGVTVHADNGPTIAVSFSAGQAPINVPRSVLLGQPVVRGGQPPAPFTQPEPVAPVQQTPAPPMTTPESPVMPMAPMSVPQPQATTVYEQPQGVPNVIQSPGVGNTPQAFTGGTNYPPAPARQPSGGVASVPQSATSPLPTAAGGQAQAGEVAPQAQAPTVADSAGADSAGLTAADRDVLRKLGHSEAEIAGHDILLRARNAGVKISDEVDELLWRGDAATVAEVAKEVEAAERSIAEPPRAPASALTPSPLAEPAPARSRKKPASSQDKALEQAKALIGKRYEDSYWHKDNDVLDAKLGDAGQIEYTVRDVETGSVRTHSTPISPRDVIGDTPPTPEASLAPRGWGDVSGPTDQPAEHEGYKSKLGKLTDTVYLSPESAKRAIALLGPSRKVKGLNVQAEYVAPLVGALQVQGEQGVAGAAELAKNIQAVAARTQAGSAKFAVAAAGLSVPETRKIVSHEYGHEAQIGFPLIDNAAFAGETYPGKVDPIYDKAWSSVNRLGYDSLASTTAFDHEIAVRAMAGQHESLGLTPEENLELAMRYVDQVVKEHGVGQAENVTRRAIRPVKEYGRGKGEPGGSGAQSRGDAEGLSRRGPGGGEGKTAKTANPIGDGIEYALSEPQRQILDEVRNGVFEGLSGLNRVAPASADAVVRFASTPQMANLYMRVKWPEFKGKFESEDGYARWQLYNVADAIEALREKLVADHEATTDTREKREIYSHINALSHVEDPITGDVITRTELEDYFGQADVQEAGRFYESGLYPPLRDARLNSGREVNGLRGLFGNHFVPKYAMNESGQPQTVGPSAFSYGRKGPTWQISSVPGSREFTGKAGQYMPDPMAAYELRLRSALKAAAQRSMYAQLLDDGVMTPTEDAETQFYHEGKGGKNGQYVTYKGREEPAVVHRLQETRWVGRGQRVGSSEQNLPSEVVMPSRLYNEIDPALELAKATPLQEMMSNVVEKTLRGYLLGTAEKIYHSASLNSRIAKMQGAFGDSQLSRDIVRMTGPGNAIFSIKNVLPNSHAAGVRFAAAKIAATNGALPGDFAEAKTSSILYGENGVLANGFAEIYEYAAKMEGAAQNPDGSYDLSSAGRRAAGLAMRKMNVHTRVQVSRLQSAITGRSQGLLATFYQTGSRNRVVALQQPLRFIVAGTLASQLLQMGIATAQDPQHRAPWQIPNYKAGEVMVGKDTDGKPIWSNLFSYADRTQYLSEWPIRSLLNSASLKESAGHTAFSLGLEGWNTMAEPVLSGPLMGAASALSGVIPGRLVPSDNLKYPQMQPSVTAKEGSPRRMLAAAQAVFPLSNVAGGPAAESNPIKDPVWFWGNVASSTLGGPRMKKDIDPGFVQRRSHEAEKLNQKPVRRR